MKCFYHNDLDGRCAGWVVHTWVGIKPNQGGYIESGFIEMNYNKPFPFEAIERGEQVWIVDFSISPQEMERLLSITEDVTWIDHHKTAIDKYAFFPYEIRGIRKDGEAGCALTFKYVHWWTDRGDGHIDLSRVNPHISVPEHVKLVEDWDLWKFHYGDRTRAFKEGCGLEDTSPSSDFWMNCMISTERIEGTIASGETAIRYRSQWAKDFMRSWAFPVTFEGYKCMAANLGSCNSEYFKSIQGEYDIMMPFVFDGKQWTVSLYSTTVDVSEIAKKFGGGGHIKASGFQCSTLPFLQPSPEPTGKQQ